MTKLATVSKVKSSSGTVRFRVRIPLPEGGYSSQQFVRERDAKRIADDFNSAVRKAEAAGHVYTQETTLVFVELAEDFLVAAKAGTRDNKAPLGPQTLRSYELYLRNRILPLIGTVPIPELTPAKLRTLRADLLRTTNTRRTAQQCFDIVKGCISYAVERGDLPHNPTTGITIQLVEATANSEGDDPDAEEEIVIPSRAEIDLLSAAAIALRDTDKNLRTREAWRRYAAMYFCFLTTGMRSGEVRALRWSDINLEAGTIRVLRAADSHDSTILTPKRHSRRRIPLHPSLAKALACMPEAAPDDYVFGGGVSKDVSNHSNIYNRFWLRLLKAAGVRHYKLHHLRHYYASRLIADGVDIKRVSAWLGHGTVAFTLDTYGHLLAGEQELGFDKVTF
jgi:integrase